MNIVFFTHYTELYGANRSLLNLIDGLKRHNVKSYVIVPSKGKIVTALKSRQIPVAIIPIQQWVDRRNSNIFHSYYLAAKRLYKNLRVIDVLINQLKTWEIDIVYTNSAVIPIGSLVARITHLPHIWHLREFMDIDYNLSLDWGKFLFNYIVSKSTAVVTVSQFLSSYFFGNISSDNTHIVYNGVAFKNQFDCWYQLNQLPRTNHQPYTFVLVGLIYPSKGQETAINALAILSKDFPNCRLILVGSGKESYVNYLQKISFDLGISDKVEFRGYISDPYEAYLTSDAVLMCSKNEAMGRVTVEAMSACRPVIGYNNAGTKELIENGDTGLLYQNGPEELAACMRRLVENPEWARKLGKNAWYVARKKYSIETYAEKIYNILLSVKK